MKYALVTHVPTYAGSSPGVVRMTEAFYQDIAAQAAALCAAGFDLTLATPRHAVPDERPSAAHRLVDVRLRDHGVEDAPLPPFRTMRQFLAAQTRLKAAIGVAARGADVVQMGAGGHPTALGQLGWPLVDPARSKRVFVFAGDPLPARQRHVTSGRNPAKQLAKRLAVRTFAAFCREAVGTADLVFAHDPGVQKRFAAQWTDRCHTFAASPIGDGDLADHGPAARVGRIADPRRTLRIVAVASPAATAGVDHVTRAVDKVRRLGANVTLALSDVSSHRTEFDAADLLLAAPLVPGEIPMIFLAAARGLPILAYRAGVTDADAAAAGAAWQVDRGETDRLSQALLDLHRDRPRLADMAAAARAWAAGVTRDAVHRRRAALVRAAVGS